MTFPDNRGKECVLERRSPRGRERRSLENFWGRNYLKDISVLSTPLGWRGFQFTCECFAHMFRGCKSGLGGDFFD